MTRTSRSEGRGSVWSGFGKPFSGVRPSWDCADLARLRTCRSKSRPRAGDAEVRGGRAGTAGDSGVPGWAFRPRGRRSSSRKPPSLPPLAARTGREGLLLAVLSPHSPRQLTGCPGPRVVLVWDRPGSHTIRSLESSQLRTLARVGTGGPTEMAAAALESPSVGCRAWALRLSGGRRFRRRVPGIRGPEAGVVGGLRNSGSWGAVTETRGEGVRSGRSGHRMWSVMEAPGGPKALPGRLGFGARERPQGNGGGRGNAPALGGTTRGPRALGRRPWTAGGQTVHLTGTGGT